MTIPLSDDLVASYTFQSATVSKNAMGEADTTFANITAITGAMQPMGKSLMRRTFGDFEGSGYMFFFNSGTLDEGNEITISSKRYKVVSVINWNTHYEATLKEIKL